jgi:hypothetical protein
MGACSRRVRFDRERLMAIRAMPAPNFDQYPQPDHSDSGSVEAALEALRNAGDESSAVDAGDALLWAVGDNHAGTFHPVVLAVLPGIDNVLASGGYWAQRAAIEALIDLGGPFAPADGYETYHGSSVRDALRTFIHSLRARIAPLAIGDDPRARSAADLLELIDDQSDQPS